MLPQRKVGVSLLEHGACLICYGSVLYIDHPPFQWQGVHLEYSPVVSTGEQKSNGTKAAPHKYLQQDVAGVGHALALFSGPTGQDVVDEAGGVVVDVDVDVDVDVVEVKQLQALEIRELPQVATGLGACLVLFDGLFSSEGQDIDLVELTVSRGTRCRTVSLSGSHTGSTLGSSCHDCSSLHQQLLQGGRPM